MRKNKMMAAAFAVMMSVSMVGGVPVSASTNSVKAATAKSTAGIHIKNTVNLDQNGRAKYNGTFANNEEYYKFTPSKTGTLKIVSTGGSNYVKNCLREEFSNQMLVDYPFIFSPNGYSLTTEYTLAKGTTYLIGALNCGSDNASYTIAFQFKELKESFPESYDTQNEEMSDAKYVELNKRYYAVRAISETADWFKFTVKSEADISVSGDVVDWDVYNSNGAPVNQSTGLKKCTYYVNFHARNANGQYSFIVIDKKAAQNNNKKPNNTVTKPKATYITKLTKGSKRFKVSVKKQSVTGYQVQYSLKSNFKGSKTKSFKGTSYTVKGLKGKKKYYVRVRSYKKSGSKTLYSAWSGKKSVKTKK